MATPPAPPGPLGGLPGPGAVLLALDDGDHLEAEAALVCGRRRGDEQVPEEEN